MKTGTAWLVYSLLRVTFFAVPFAIFYALNWHWAIAAVLATLIAAALSVIFLWKPRQRAAMSIHEWREKDRMHDDIVEDAAIEGVIIDEERLGADRASADRAGADRPAAESKRERDSE